MSELVPVRIGGHVVAYRPQESAPTKTPAKKAAKKQATSKDASTAEEATK